MVRLIYFFYIFINAFLLSFQDKSGYSLFVWFGHLLTILLSTFLPLFKFFSHGCLAFFCFVFPEKKKSIWRFFPLFSFFLTILLFVKKVQYTDIQQLGQCCYRFDHLQFWNVGAYIYFRFIPVQGKSLGLPPFASQMRKLRLHVLVFNLVEQ